MGRFSDLRERFGAKAHIGGGLEITGPDGKPIEFKRGTTDEDIARALNLLKKEHHMSAIERLKAKALQAKNVAPDAIKRFEADLDSILADKEAIENQRAAAVAPHQEAIASVKGEICGLKSAIDILSND
jgi:hypothetical protein